MSSVDVDHLIQKAEESIRAAIILNKENLPDFAASRAYYAMFYLAEALLLKKGKAFSSHSAVIAAFGKEFTRGELLDLKYHRYLMRAQELRNVGDYAIQSNVTIEQVNDLLLWAEDFLDTARLWIKQHYTE
jgi:uncharacterized protein (UPF0332 family)